MVIVVSLAAISASDLALVALSLASSIPALAETSTSAEIPLGRPRDVIRASLAPWLYPMRGTGRPTDSMIDATKSMTSASCVDASTLRPWPGRSGAMIVYPSQELAETNCSPVNVNPWRATSGGPLPNRRTPITIYDSSMGISVVSTLYTMPAIAATKAREMRIFMREGYLVLGT